MNSLFIIVCIIALLFYGFCLWDWFRQRRPRTGESVVRKLPQTEAVDAAAGRRFLVQLEKQMAEFVSQNRSAAMVLVMLVLVLTSASLVAQEREPAGNSNVQEQGPVVQQQPPEGGNSPATPAANQPQPAAPTPAPSSLPTPAITGPLQAAAPITFEGGPFGKLNLNGIVSGTGMWQGNHVPGDNTTQAALSNGQIFLQKTTSWWQFYIQAGAYDILSLGTPFLSTQRVVSDLYGPVPVAYLKFVPTKSTSILIGSLPTLMGAEYTFDFQNMNIERGLLWNQENAINRGIQVNQSFGKFTASLSWNDGYYSNRYSWLSGALTYVNGPHSLSFIGMGNLGQTAFQTLATPVQNNSLMYAAIYTYTKGSWIVQPYFQYSNVPTNPSVGVLHGASTWGGAVLASHTFKHGFSLAGRGEYISTTGSVAKETVNLLYGPGSGGWSITLTPTYQYQRFFTRADFSWVQATNFTPGSAFGSAGTNANQPRGVLEVGFLF